MPDFLDSVISRARENTPVLRPRTPGLFEPAPAGYGPGGRFNPGAAFSARDVSDSPFEERPAAVGPQHVANIPAGEDVDHPVGSPRMGAPTESRPGDAPRQAAQYRPETARVIPTERVSGRVEPAAPEGSMERLRAVPARLGATRPVPSTAPTESRPADGLAHVAEGRPEAGQTVPTERASASGTMEPVMPEGLMERPRAVPAGLTAARSGQHATPGMFRPAEPRIPEASPVGPAIRGPSDAPGDADREFPVRPQSPGPPFISPASLPDTARRDLLARLAADVEGLRRPANSRMDSGRRPSTAVNALRPPMQPPSAAGRPSETAAPLQIQVNIARVEVRAAPAAVPAPAQPRSAHGAAPVSLDEYLRRRNGGPT